MLVDDVMPKTTYGSNSTEGQNTAAKYQGLSISKGGWGPGIQVLTRSLGDSHARASLGLAGPSGLDRWFCPDSASVGLKWGQRFCISNKLLSDADVAGPRALVSCL